MNKLLAMMLGSAGAAALNLIALTLAASRVELASLDVYFVYRDATESLLRLLFVSQIGSICVAVARTTRTNRPVRQALFAGGAGTAAALGVWTVAFPAFVDQFLPAGSPIPITGRSVMEVAVAVFCLCTWLDAVASSQLIQQRKFALNHAANSVGAAMSCVLMLAPASLTVQSMATAFAVGKFITTLPKVLSAIRSVRTSTEDDAPPKAKPLQSMLSMALPYTPGNFLLQFNKFAYLAGVAFLAPGVFAIFSIYRRYYTAAQNLITVNIFNLSASHLTDAQETEVEIPRLINRHTLSFLAIYALCSGLMLICALPAVRSHLPEFVTSPYAPLLWSVTLLNFLPDGVNFVLSRQSMLDGDIKVDSRINSVQAVVNLIALYPSMRYFGVAGLAYATLFVCAVFAAFRLWRLHLHIPATKQCIKSIAIYGALLLAVSCFSQTLRPLEHALLTVLVSVPALAHAYRESRLQRGR